MAGPVIALACPRCGARLGVYDDMDSFACGSCGTSITVQRRGGTVALTLGDANVGATARSARTGLDPTIVRLEKELLEAAARVEHLKNTSPSLPPSGVASLLRAIASGLIALLLFTTGQASGNYADGVTMMMLSAPFAVCALYFGAFRYEKERSLWKQELPRAEAIRQADMAAAEQDVLRLRREILDRCGTSSIESVPAPSADIHASGAGPNLTTDDQPICNCGAALRPDARFCESCGAAIQAVTRATDHVARSTTKGKWIVATAVVVLLFLFFVFTGSSSSDGGDFPKRRAQQTIAQYVPALVGYECRDNSYSARITGVTANSASVRLVFFDWTPLDGDAHGCSGSGSVYFQRFEDGWRLMPVGPAGR